jgi:hypothetical protein
VQIPLNCRFAAHRNAASPPEGMVPDRKSAIERNRNTVAGGNVAALSVNGMNMQMRLGGIRRNNHECGGGLHAGSRSARSRSFRR